MPRQYVQSLYQTPPGNLVVSGNEITDLSRATNTQGDGLSNDSSFGTWPAATNLVLNGGFETNAANYTTIDAGTIAQGASLFVFGTKGGVYTAAAGLAEHGIRSNFISGLTAGNTYTVSVCLRASAGNQWALVGDDRDNVNTHQAWFDINAGTVGLTRGTIVSASIKPIKSSGFFRCTVTYTKDAGAGTNGAAVVELCTANGVATFTAAGTEVLYIDGVQFEAGPVATPYIETNGATATRAAARVQAPAALINATQGWFACNMVMGFPSTVQPGVGQARIFHWYDSSTSVVECYWTGTRWYFARVNAVNGISVVVADTFAVGDSRSIIVTWTATTVAISLNGAAFVSAGNTFIPTMAATTINIGSDSGGTEQIGSNVKWSAVGTGTLSNTDVAAAYLQSNNDPSLASFPETANVTAVMPFSTSAFSTPTRTTAIATTALTTSGNEITDASRATNTQGDGLSNDSSYGIWPAATNLVLNGGFESGVMNHTPVNATLVQSTAQFKFGTKSGLLTAAAGAGNHYTVASAAAVTNATVYTASVVAKYSNNQWIEVGYDRGPGYHTAYFDIQNGAVGNSNGVVAAKSIVALPGGWYRCIVTFTSDSTNGGVSVYLASANGADSYTAAGTEAVYIDGVQLETGNTATPYIETNGATATRAAARVQAPAALINATQGWFASRFRLEWPSTAAANLYGGGAIGFFEWANAGSTDYFFGFIGADGSFGMGINSGASSNNAVSTAQTWAAGATFTVVCTWTSTLVAISINGGAFTTIGRTVNPAGLQNTFDISSGGSFGRQLQAETLWTATGTGTLSNTDVAAAYFQSNTDPTLSSFPETANVSMVWPALTATFNPAN